MPTDKTARTPLPADGPNRYLHAVWLASVGRKSEAPSAIFGCIAAVPIRRPSLHTRRDSDLLVREVETLRAAIRAVRLAAPFHIDAWVILPDHMHCIWTLPEEDTDYSGRWRAIKKRFSKALPNVELRRPEVLAREGRGVWHKRFWEHTIRDDRDYCAHMDYVHFNPVKHGLVARPAEWPYSTFLKCVALGFYDSAWTSPDQTHLPSAMGERP